MCLTLFIRDEEEGGEGGAGEELAELEVEAGGAGDDAISGAEALPDYYASPVNPGNLLRWGEERAGEFAAYDEFDPRREIEVNDDGEHVVGGDYAREFLLNFDPMEGVPMVEASRTIIPKLHEHQVEGLSWLARHLFAEQQPRRQAHDGLRPEA